MVGEPENGPATIIDSSGAQFGTHSGLTPMEHLLVGLLGCTAMDVVSIMAKMRQPMTNLQVKADADRATEHPRVFTAIHIEYIAYGTGIDPQSLKRAIELSEQRYCSAQGMLGKVVEITSSYRVVESPNPTLPGELPDAG